MTTSGLGVTRPVLVMPTISPRKVIGLVLALILLCVQVTFLPNALRQADSPSEILFTLLGASIWWLLIYLFFSICRKRKPPTSNTQKNPDVKPQKLRAPKAEQRSWFRFSYRKLYWAMGIIGVLSFVVIGAAFFFRPAPKPSVSADVRVLIAAAERGDAEAQYELAVGQDRFGSKDVAFAWALKAANQDYPLAYNFVGTYYLGGVAVPLNYKNAAAWLKKAAEFGIAEAQLNLALMYQYGDGIEQDFEKAYIWFTLAKAGGVETDAYVLLIEPGQEERVQAEAAQVFEQIKRRRKMYCDQHADYNFCKFRTKKASASQ